MMKIASQQVRIFISSTFIDMQKERDILVQDIYPVIKGLCNNLGIAFNMIDLRWGITEEDKSQSKVLELCLDEIQHCKPYFIGLIGNRYGTTLNDFNPDIEEKYGFIKSHRDKSITEIEMMLGAMIEENRERCFFYYKDPKLFDKNTNDGHDNEIKELKKKINALGIYHNDYSSFDSFKELVQKDLQDAISADYPQGIDCIDLRQKAFLDLEVSTYIERSLWEGLVSDVIAYAEQHHVAIVAVTNTPSGKTTTFNYIVNEKINADKIIINFEADVKMRYFPAHYLYSIIKNGLHSYGYYLKDFEEFPEPEFLNNYESSVLSMLSILKKNLYTIEYRRPLYILINDANLFLEKDKSKTFSKTFLFDTQTLPDNLYVIITSNEIPETQIPCIQINEAITVESAKNFFVNYLSRFGKKIDRDLLDNASRSLHFCEYKLIADYLISYCNYSCYRRESMDLLSKQNYIEILMYIYDCFVSKMNDKCAVVFTEILLRIFFYKPGIPEQFLFASYNKETALEITEYQMYEDLTDIEKSFIIRALRYFCNTVSGVIYVSSQHIENFIANNISHLMYVLYKNNSERTRKAFENSFSRFKTVTHVIQKNHMLTKDEFMNNVTNGNGLEKLIGYAIFDPLCIVLDKALTEYSKEIGKDKNMFDAGRLTDYETDVLVSVQEAANLYKFNTRTDLYGKIISNVDLMLFICSKSHALVKRLLYDYIDLNTNIHKAHFSHVDKKSIAFSINYLLEPIINADREKYPELLVNDVADIAVTALEKYGMTFYQKLELGKVGNIIHDMNDYVVNACSTDVEDVINEIDFICDFKETEDVAKTITILEEYFNKTTNIFDKFLYAYYLIKAVHRLTEEDMLTDEIFENGLSDCLAEIMLLRPYCFFPEVTEFIDDFFEHI